MLLEGSVPWLDGLDILRTRQEIFIYLIDAQFRWEVEKVGRLCTEDLSSRSSHVEAEIARD